VWGGGGVPFYVFSVVFHYYVDEIVYGGWYVVSADDARF